MLNSNLNFFRFPKLPEITFRLVFHVRICMVRDILKLQGVAAHFYLEIQLQMTSLQPPRPSTPKAMRPSIVPSGQGFVKNFETKVNYLFSVKKINFYNLQKMLWWLRGVIKNCRVIVQIFLGLLENFEEIWATSGHKK